MTGDSLDVPPRVRSADPVLQAAWEQHQADPAAFPAAGDARLLLFKSSTPPCRNPEVFDPLPEPQGLTVGEGLWLIESSALILAALARWSADESRKALDRDLASADFTGLLGRLRLANDPAPILKDAWERRQIVLFESPETPDLERFANIECDSPLNLQAARELRRRLSKLLGKGWDEVHAMPLVEAVSRIRHTQPVDLPTGDVRSAPRQALPVGPPVGPVDATFVGPADPPAAGPSPLGTAAPSDPTEGDRTEPPAAGSARTPRGDRQAKAGDAPGTAAEPPEGKLDAGPLPRSLDAQAVGIAHEMNAGQGWINVAEVARRLNVDRTKLYRECPGFRAMVDVDRKSKKDRRNSFRRGSKDGETGRIECADDD